MGGFCYVLRYSMGGDAGSLELAVADVRPGETLIADDGRRLLVIDVVPFDEEDAKARG